MKTLTIGRICALNALCACLTHGAVERDVDEPGEDERLPDATVTAPAERDATRGVPTVTGRVVDLGGAPFEGAEVWACGTTSSTDEQGWFRVSSAGVEGCESVQARAPGGVPTGQPLSFDETAHAIARIILPPPPARQVIESSGPSTAGSAQGALIRFPGGGFSLEDGNTWGGRVVVAITHLHDATTMAGAPGGLATAGGPLESSGMIGVQLETMDGRALTFSGDAVIQVPSAFPRAQGDPTALYHWSEGDRHWTRSGEATLQGGVWTATVSSFSWWNLDKPAETRGCVRGQIGTPIDLLDLSGTMVYARGANGVQNRAITDRAGEFCVDLPEGPAEIFAVLVQDDVAWEWTTSVTVDGDGGECGGTACTADVGRLVPRGRQLACVTGVARRSGCVTVLRGTPVHAAQPTDWIEESFEVKQGAFTKMIPWSHQMKLSENERPQSILDHGQGAQHLAVGDAAGCLNLGEISTTPARGGNDSGIDDTGGSSWTCR